MNRPVWVVESVQAHEDYTLSITFAGGVRRVYDARPLLAKAIYKPFENVSFFMCARAECGTVIWNDDVDIAPEHLYECGVPVQ